MLQQPDRIKKLLEERLLESVKECLTGDDMTQYFIQEANKLLAEEKSGFAPGLEQKKVGIEAANAKIDNIMNAIKAGIITATMKDELIKAEAERDLLRKEMEVYSNQMQKIGAILPGAKEWFKTMLEDLQQSLKREIPKARNIIKQIFGEDIALH